MTSWPWQLARNCSKHSSALRQISQNPTSAKKTCQHDVDKLMKSNKLSEAAKQVVINLKTLPILI